MDGAASVSGKVCLVGAGPGDPGLLTLKGARCLREADVVVYDHLVGEGILAHLGEGAERIFVGKEAGRHTLSQDGINRLLAEQALAGKTVVRLKGGDPFVFGRGGEEAEYLQERGIPFEIVPGITSAVAAPAYAGIPVTHRSLASSFAVLTGHEDPAKAESAIAWDRLATAVDTLVFLMGVGNLAQITSRLIQHGRSPETPAAVIRWGTTASQESVTGTLATIAEEINRAGLQPPAVLVVGEVVELRQRLAWFESKPLFGRTVVVTRARAQASAFADLLEAEGAAVVQVPVIQVDPPESWAPLDQAIARIERYGWIIFTSVNGVEAFLARLREGGRDLRDLHQARIAAIGSETAERLRRGGLRPDLVPPQFRAESLAEVLGPHIRPGSPVLLPRATVARDLLLKALSELGATVTEVPAYQTVPVRQGAEQVRALLRGRKIHCVTFTSSSTVHNFLSLFDPVEAKELLEGVAVACIGPVTAETAEGAGLTVAIVPPSYTVSALAGAIVEYYRNQAPLPS